MSKLFVSLLVLLLPFTNMAYSADNNDCALKLGSEICVKIKFHDGMDRKKDSKFELSFLDKNNKTIKLDQTPLVKLWMVMKSGHGHGSEDLKLSWSENVYQIENVWFEMLGQWKIKIQLMRSGKESKGEIPICVMRDSTKGHVGSCL